ncbi:DUF4864 domain-containing protein [Hwanghaeella sp.]|uniref:DUF4864 domain-containing protein n=1 Tax=Hwanghaeella sp. TaxID=2605943 RepID=UPI003CCBD321
MKRISAFSRLSILTLFAVALMVAPQAGQAQSADTRTAVTAVIQSQLDAFRRDDGPGAYSHAAPNIQSIFPTVGVFMQMVRRGYGFLIDPAAVEFLDIRTEAGTLYQAVRVIGRDGVRRIAIYQMERQEDGSWKIAGVFITEDPAAAV